MLLQFILLIVSVELIGCDVGKIGKDREKRYLVFGPSTQYGAFATISIPLSEPNKLVSVAWFFEANYFTVDNATWLEPLLGDVTISKSREKRAAKQQKEIITRSLLYSVIESMLQKHGYDGRPCLLRSICETSTSHFSHNGLLGDLFHLILAPSSSLDDDVQDCYYEAEYRGLDDECGRYYKNCPTGPLNHISTLIDHLL